MKSVLVRLLLIALAVAGVVLWFRFTLRAPREDTRVLGRVDADTAPRPYRHPVEAEWFRMAAERAWDYVDASWEPRTGFVRTVPEYPVATVWDIGSGIAALFSAHELGLIERSEYERRLGRLLETLQRLPLFERAALNKTYSTITGRMLGRDDEVSDRGFGWSAIDLGRLLIWLRVIADREPAFTSAAERIVRRMDLGRIVRDGYLHGEDLSPRGRARAYREGSLGYEQYAATGFALWGHPARHSQRLTTHAVPIGILGDTVLADTRPDSCLTSEPFVLAGLETGWSPAMRVLALGVLRVQEARWERTGQVTVASEDASDVPPWHFYYYCVLADNTPFDVTGPQHLPAPDGPKTVSAKGAFGWYALVPTPYTARALDYVAEAWHDLDALIVGVEEGTGRAVGPPNVNTAAVLLEAAAFLARGGRPLLGS